MTVWKTDLLSVRHGMAGTENSKNARKNIEAV